MSQGADPSDTSGPIEEEIQLNEEDTNLRRSGRDRKNLSPYGPYFEGKRYGSKLLVMKMEDNMTTARNLDSIAVNAIFDQVLKTDPTQEATGSHKKMLYERGYKMFGESEIEVMFKE